MTHSKGAGRKLPENKLTPAQKRNENAKAYYWANKGDIKKKRKKKYQENKKTYQAAQLEYLHKMKDEEPEKYAAMLKRKREDARAIKEAAGKTVKHRRLRFDPKEHARKVAGRK